MFRLLVWIAFLVVSTSTAFAGYLDENPDEVFATVYERLGTIPVAAARDPFVWLRLQELKREPCDQKSIDDLAVALDKLGYRREAANGLYKFVLKCGAPLTALNRAINLYLKITDFAQAVEVADEFVRRAPSYHDAHYLRAIALDGAGDHQRALVDYSDAIELWGADKKGISSTVFVRMASAYAYLGRFCEATVPINTWISYDPASRDTSRSRKIISDYEQQGHCVASVEFQKERFPVRGQKNVVLVKAAINGVSGLFILDTGASYLSVKSGFADRAKISRGDAGEITLASANGEVKAKLARADKVVLGKLQAANVPIAIQENDKSYGANVDGLLGMSFLSRFEVQMADGFIEVRTRQPKK